MNRKIVLHPGMIGSPHPSTGCADLTGYSAHYHVLAPSRTGADADLECGHRRVVSKRCNVCSIDGLDDQHAKSPRCRIAKSPFWPIPLGSTHAHTRITRAMPSSRTCGTRSRYPRLPLRRRIGASRIPTESLSAWKQTDNPQHATTTSRSTRTIPACRARHAFA